MFAMHRFALRAGITTSLILASAAHAQAPDPASDQVIGTAALPRDLSPWGMFVSADIVLVRGKSDDVLLADGTTISNKQFGGSWILSVGLDVSGVLTMRLF